MLVWILAAAAWAGTCDRLYWTDGTRDAIRSVDRAGTVREVIRLGAPHEDAGPWAVWVHGEHVYWGDHVRRTVSRVPVTGGTPEVLAENVLGPFGVAVDPRGAELFWADQDARVIRARSLSEGVARDVATEMGGGDGRGTTDLTTDGRWLYFTELSTRTVQRIRPDGTGLETLVTEPADSQPTAIAIDRQREVLYWGDFTRGVVRTSGLDGREPTEVARFPGARVQGVAVDPARRHLYVSLHRVSLEAEGTLHVAEPIVRIDLATGAEQVVVDQAGAVDLFWVACDG